MRLRPALISAPLLLILLVGCAPETTTVSTSTPSPSSSASAVATPIETNEAATTVDRVVLSASDLTLWGGDEQRETLSTDKVDVEATVAGLADVLGEPSIERLGLEPSECANPETVYSWGDAVVIEVFREEGGSWDIARVRFLAATADGADGTEVGLEASTGVSVGDDVSAMIAEAPDEAKSGYDAEGVRNTTVVVEEDPRLGPGAYPDSQGMWGLGIDAEDGVATSIEIPSVVNAGIDC